MRMFEAESQAYLLAGDRFYEDPEDAESAQHKFFQSSVFVLTLAIAADSTNASAEFHLGKVLARKSYTGSGTWDTNTLRAAVRHLARAQRLAAGRYQSLKSDIDKALQHERANLDSLGHH
jgi:hypothetical protein